MGHSRQTRIVQDRRAGLRRFESRESEVVHSLLLALLVGFRSMYASYRAATQLAGVSAHQRWQIRPSPHQRDGVKSRMCTSPHRTGMSLVMYLYLNLLPGLSGITTHSVSSLAYHISAGCDARPESDAMQDTRSEAQELRTASWPRVPCHVPVAVPLDSDMYVHVHSRTGTIETQEMPQRSQSPATKLKKLEHPYTNHPERCWRAACRWMAPRSPPRR